jgi:hypothetical protein
MLCDGCAGDSPPSNQVPSAHAPLCIRLRCVHNAHRQFFAMCLEIKEKQAPVISGNFRAEGVFSAISESHNKA